MASHGPTGKPRGRPPGSKSSKDVLKEEAIKQILKNKKTPLDFMLTVMSGKDFPLSLRIDAAKAAAPYVHKRMPASIEHSGEVGHVHRGGVMVVPAPQNNEDWARRAAESQKQLKEEVKH